MNFLAHAFLSFGDADILTGNMIGDHVKGSAALDDYPEKVKQGILLHRKIDSYTDADASALRARVWFRQTYGLYSGPIVDTIFDHYLATDPHYFKTENSLLSFTQDVYKKLESNSRYFPDSFAAIFPHMKEHNWLYNYRTTKGISRSLQGLHRRAKYMEDPTNAYETFITRYYEVGQCYYEFIERIYKFVNDELSS